MSDKEDLIVDDEDVSADNTADVSDDIVADQESDVQSVADESVTDEEVSEDEPKAISDKQKRHEERLARHAGKHTPQAKHEARTERHADKGKTKKASDGKKGFGLWRWIKAIFLELKKVTWPSFGKVVKTTAVVLGIVLFFLVALMIMDATLGFLFRRMMGEIFGDPSTFISYLTRMWRR
ncbi:MAG: preprotein translocase subunit SecE [Firmicutes bacterium]|nr:preprotein translocase subunit SecE [Bacillota bacterium]